MSKNQKLFLSLVVGLCAFALGFSRLQLSNEISTMLPLQDDVVRDYFFVADQFKTLESLYIDIDGENLEADELERMTAVSDALYERLLSSGLFTRIQYRLEESSLMGLYNTIGRAHPALLDETDLEVVESRLNPESIHRYVARAKRSLTTSLTSMEKRRLRSDPFDIAGLGFAHIGTVGNQSPGAQIVDGRITSQDGRHILLFAIPSFPPGDTEQSEKLFTLLEKTRTDLLKMDDAVRIRYSGGHFAYADNAAIIKTDMKRTVPAMILGIFLLSILFFRRIFSVALILVPVTFGLAVALAAFSFYTLDVPGLVIGCAALLIGISVDYGIHVVFHLENSKSDDISDIKFPIVVGAVTTLLAFLTLLLSGIEGQRHMGILAALGIAGSAWFAVNALPQLVSFFSASKRNLDLSGPINRLLQWVDDYWQRTLITVVTISCVALAGLPRVNFEGDLESMNYLHPEHRAEDTYVRDLWQKMAPSVVVLAADSTEMALEKNDRLYNLLMALENEKIVQSTVSLSPLLPSHATQKERWSNWASLWPTEKKDSVRAMTATEGKTIGFTPKAFDPFFKYLNEEPTFLTLADYEDSSMSDLIASRIVKTDEKTLLQSSFYTEDRDSFLEARTRIQESYPDAIIMNGSWFAGHTQKLVNEEMLQFGIAASAVIVLCLLLFFGSVELAAVVLLPVLFGLLLTLGILGWIGLPINFVSSLFIIYVLGVGVDFNIFLLNSKLQKYRSQKDIPSSPGAVVLCALTTLFGFGALALAHHPAIHSMGVTGFLGILSCLAASLSITPLLIRLFIPQNGIHGIGTIPIILRAVWTLISLMSQAAFYSCILKPIWFLRYGNNRLEKQKKTRSVLRSILRNHLDQFPYKNNPRIFHDVNEEDLKKPAIFTCNHQSLNDAPLLLTINCDMVMVVKPILLKLPFFGTILKDSGFIASSKKGYAETLKQCENTLKDGVSVLFFPEGTRSHDGVIRRFRNGAFELAVRTGADVIPVLVSNTRTGIHGHRFAVDQYSWAVRTLPRITPENFDYETAPRAFAKEVKNRIIDFADEDFREAQKHDTFWSRLNTSYAYQGSRVRRMIKKKIQTDRLLMEIDTLVPEGAKVLVMGSDDGLFGNTLARKSNARAVTGIDVEESRIAIANSVSRDRNNISYVSVSEWDSLTDTWDYILMIDPDESQTVSMIESANKHVSEDGAIVLRSPEVQLNETFNETLDACNFDLQERFTTLEEPDESVWKIGRTH